MHFSTCISYILHTNLWNWFYRDGRTRPSTFVNTTRRRTRWSCDFSYPILLFYAIAVIRVVGRNECFLHRGASSLRTICYTSSSLSSSGLGKKDTLPYHFFRINWWKEELNKAKHGGVRRCRCWPAAPSLFLGLSLMIAEYLYFMDVKLFLILIY